MKTHQPDILIVRSKKIEAKHIDADENLKVIIRAGAGYDTIDVEHATAKKVTVANCPGKNATAVAELTMGLILSVDRRLGENYALQKEGKWRKGMFTECLGLKGKFIFYSNINLLLYYCNFNRLIINKKNYLLSSPSLLKAFKIP